MNPSANRPEPKQDLTSADMEVILRAARQQARNLAPESHGDETDWRTLGYIVLGGSIFVLLALQLLG